MATIRRKKSEPFAIVQKDPGPWPQVLINWLATLAVIIVFGLIMLFSASYTTGYLRMGDSFYYIKVPDVLSGAGAGGDAALLPHRPPLPAQAGLAGLFYLHPHAHRGGSSVRP